MSGFLLTATGQAGIRFRFYDVEAPATAAAFLAALPFEQLFLHARVSGQEIWCSEAPALPVPQENSTIHCRPGEVAIGPLQPARNQVSGLMGIFYGEGKLVDGANIFAAVVPEDLPLLVALGDQIWRRGGLKLRFSPLD